MNAEPPPFNPKFRKRKRFQGASWTPPNQSAEAGEGAWCKACRTRHGYKLGLNINYERRGGAWWILWSCKKTGNVVEETELGGGNGAVRVSEG